MLISQHKINIFLSFCLKILTEAANPHDKSGKFVTQYDKILTTTKKQSLW